jgi:hypothetical protein
MVTILGYLASNITKYRMTYKDATFVWMWLPPRVSQLSKFGEKKLM